MTETREARASWLHARFAPSSYNDEQRTVEVVWSTGADVRRRDWDGEFTEQLSMDAGAVDLSRLAAGAPVLNSHDAYSLSSVLGVVERAWLENGEGRAVLRFSDRADVQPILSDIRAGILRNISVGYDVQKWEEGKDKAGKRTKRAVRWQPAEISLVPVPADASAQVRAADAPADPAGVGDTEQPNKEGRMADNAPQVPEAPAPTINREDVANEARGAERARVAELRSFVTVAQRQRILPPERLDAIEQEAIASGADAASVRARVMDEVLAQPQAPAPAPRPVQMHVTRDAGDTMRLRIKHAIASGLRGLSPSETPEEAREFRGMGFSGMLREMAIEAGDRTAHRLNNDQLWSRAAGSHSTSDFPVILKDAVNVTLQQEFGEFPRIFEVWSQSTDVQDFKQITSANVGTMPTLEKVAEGQPIPHKAIAEEGEVYKVDTYAGIVAMTREMIINDQLSAFGRVIRNAADSANRALNDLVYAQITENANMADGNRLFSTAHANIGANASGTVYHYLFAPDRPTVEVAYLSGRRAPEITEEEQFNVLGVSYRVVFDFGAKAVSWRGVTRERSAVLVDGSTVGVLEEKLLTMREVGGAIIAPPRRLVLLVPPSQHVAARRLVTSVTPDSASNVNIYGGLQLVVEPRLANTTVV
jgi:phage head maturation protease/phage major head subunit gpT-like protein